MDEDDEEPVPLPNVNAAILKKVNLLCFKLGRSRKDPHLPHKFVISGGGVGKIYFRRPKGGRGNEDIACPKG